MKGHLADRQTPVEFISPSTPGIGLRSDGIPYPNTPEAGTGRQSGILLVLWQNRW